jgi:CspA family cold shock protein
MNDKRFIRRNSKMNGTVKFFNAGKGFGFIAGEDGKEYFVHQTALKEGLVIQENDAVTFDVVMGDRGPKAENVALGGAAPAEEAPAEEPAAEEAPAEEEQTE